MVKVKSSQSLIYPVTSGVPQGSHLGPLLFLLFINDIHTIFKDVSFLLFADDLKIFKVIKCYSDVLILQENLNSLFSWCLNNDLNLNISKCIHICFTRNKTRFDFSYSINDIQLNSTDSEWDLGIIFDTKLDFIKHINEIKTKALKMLGFIFRLSKNFNTIKYLYITLVRPTLEFSSIVWSPYYKYQISTIESVQQKFLRYINWKINATFNADYNELTKYLGIESLEKRRLNNDLIFLYK